MRADFLIATGRRRGMTLMEMLVALVVISAAMVAMVQFLGVARQQRRANWQRLAAQLEVANQAERIALLAWDETAADKLTAWQPSETVAAAIPAAACRITVTEEAGPPLARKIALRVTWKNAVGQEVEPSELTTWKFRTEAKP